MVIGNMFLRLVGSKPAELFRSPGTSNYATALPRYSAQHHQAPYQLYPSVVLQSHRNTPQNAHECRRTSQMNLDVYESVVPSLAPEHSAYVATDLPHYCKSRFVSSRSDTFSFAVSSSNISCVIIIFLHSNLFYCHMMNL